MDLRIAWLGVICLPVFAGTPLCFEPGDHAYVAHALGAAVTVDGSGARFRSPAGTAHMRLLQARRGAVLIPEQRSGTENVLVGSDPAKWRRGIPLFAAVRAAGVYPGIDVVYHGRDRLLEYDFKVAPGARPSRISLRFEGPGRLLVDSHGDLRTAAGDKVVQRRPEAYQVIHGERRQVASRFQLEANGSIRFAVGEYDRTLPLVIDPVVSYSSFWGGKNVDEGHGVTVDAGGNLIAVGLTYSTTTGVAKAMVRKIPASGQQVQTLVGGTTNDWANAVTTDSLGNVYLTGRTTSPDFPNVLSQFQCTGTGDAFLTSLTSDLQGYNFSGCIGGLGEDEGFAIATAPNNLIYLAGHTNSTTFPIGSGAWQPTNGGGYDAFWMAFTIQGTYTGGTYIGGSGDEHAYGLAVDVSGYAYIVGTTSSGDYKTNSGAFQTSNHGGSDAFVFKLSSDGSQAAYSTLIGGKNDDRANAAQLDSSGRLYISGTTASDDFPVGGGGFQTTFGGGASDGFVFVLEPDFANGYWSTFIGGKEDDTLGALALDPGGDIWVAGGTNGDSWPVTSDAAQAKRGGAQDAVIARVSKDGTTLVSSSFLGGAQNDLAKGIAVSSAGYVFVTGVTNSAADFPASGAAQATYGGGDSDGFITAYQITATPAAISANGVTNAANFLADPVAPGSIISIFGTGFAQKDNVAAAPLPTTLGGVSVKVNGEAVPLFYAGPKQINAQLPYDIVAATAAITVTGPGGTSAASSFAVVPAAPGIFLAGGRALVQNQDYSLNTAANGAKPGSTIIVYFTGQGPLSPTIATGASAPASPLSSVTSTKSATINGQDAPVAFMGMAPAFVGLAQANLVVPPLSPGDYPVVLKINGVSSAAATITVTAP